jgi:hypothetical protein
MKSTRKFPTSSNTSPRIATPPFPKLLSTLPLPRPTLSSRSTVAIPRRIFPFYSLINPSVGSESDEVLTRKIAEQLTREEEGEQSTRFGYLIKGFPFNTNQALLLDRYLNGVNLALHLKSKDESSDYTSSIESLLGYYEHRVHMMILRALFCSWSWAKVSRPPSNLSKSWTRSESRSSATDYNHKL